ncbi:MAG: ATP-grasp domain-containing protein [Candidatus Dojkabacteria bacterium]|nr:ATP-grasp domain-containing protein [Candidatus Dojkabacteria bacterium]
MNKIAKNLLDKINSILVNKPLIYISKDIERSIGLENYLENYHQICAERSYIYTILKEKKYNVYLIENLKDMNTLSIVNSEEFNSILKTITRDGSFYAMLFQFNEPAKLNLEKNSGIVLNNSAVLNRKFENKINISAILQQHQIQEPTNFVGNVGELSYEDIRKKLSLKDNQAFVIQTPFSHTGTGTYFIYSQEEWEEVKQKLFGNKVKFSTKITGETYTLNGCIYKNQVFFDSIQYQITGEKDLTINSGTTVGNDWQYSKKLNINVQKKIIEILRKIANILISNGYKGLFGIDLIVTDNDDIYVLEINARQTANVSMETKLQLENEDTIPLLLLHIAEFLKIDIDIDEKTFNKNFFNFYNASQVFLRAKKNNTIICNDIKSGIYRIVGDASAYMSLIKRNFTNTYTLVIDEDKDKILVWEENEYTLDYSKSKDRDTFENKHKDKILILNATKGNVKNLHEEVARVQLRRTAIVNSKVAEWIIKTLKAIEDTITI